VTASEVTASEVTASEWLFRLSRSA
jgi:hypothetical protein